MATIFDVARAAGVSHQTVSRVLKGDPTVGAERRERVEAAVAELAYRPSAAARALASGRSRTLGVVTAADQYYGPASTAHGFTAAARRAGWHVSTEALEGDDADEIGIALATLASLDVRAIVVVAPTPAVRAALAASANREERDAEEGEDADEVAAGDSPPGPRDSDRAQTRRPRPTRGDRTAAPPIVVAGHPESGRRGAGIDQRAGAEAAVAHLVAAGHERIAHLAGPTDWWDARDREAGWRAALMDAGLEPGPLMRGDWTPASGAAATAELVASGATAVFCGNDQMALGLLSGLDARGVAVPDDMSVVGFDDLPESAYLVPALTTVRQDFAALGARLLEVVLAALDGDDPPSVPLPAVLVERASVGPPPR